MHLSYKFGDWLVKTTLMSVHHYLDQMKQIIKNAYVISNTCTRIRSEKTFSEYIHQSIPLVLFQKFNETENSEFKYIIQFACTKDNTIDTDTIPS